MRILLKNCFSVCNTSTFFQSAMYFLFFKCVHKAVFVLVFPRLLICGLLLFKKYPSFLYYFIETEIKSSLFSPAFQL